ncbi:DEAD/DEAH box helicase [Nocardia sp. alder85J]|uniref:DEAD/DEAH box helicase n=1 Tax=Nocardia sp. alder85J TaxID=2862949 RepID=UPI001CD4BC2D|nr:DEAD/DEAH box helicase [Nocardia sp. alder85J]MCX4092666.1 DEAD/DEAH box helicase [Nocardia sp. alder85J]
MSGNGGGAVAAPVRFADLGLPAVLVQALRRDGLETAFPIQAAVIPDILAGHDVLGRAATGSGKTLAFGLPMLVRLTRGASAPKKPRGLILAPTRELALQIERALDEPALALGLRLATAVGGVPIKRQIDRLARGADLLVATPGRLADLIAHGAARLEAVRVVTIDEADHMSELGFLDQVTTLLDHIPPDAQHLLFSATLDAAVDTLTTRYLRTPIHHTIPTARDKSLATQSNSGDIDAADRDDDAAATGTVPPAGDADPAASSIGPAASDADPVAGATNSTRDRTGTPADRPAETGSNTPSDVSPLAGQRDSNRLGQTGREAGPSGPGTSRADIGHRTPEHPAGGPNRPSASHYLLLVRKADKRTVVTEIAARPGRTLLFARTQFAADKLARQLREAGIAAVALHGGMTQNQRTRALAAFTGGAASALVATDIAARGIHVDDISLVLHVDPPQDAKDYIHRAGRTARAGATGTVATLVTPDDHDAVTALLAEAPITYTELRSSPGDSAIAALIGARPPSGNPVPDPAAAQDDATDRRTVPDTRPGTRFRKATGSRHNRSNRGR